MRIFGVAALIIVLLPALAHAQEENKAPLTNRSDEQKKEDAAVDKAYRAATKGTRSEAPKVDPWQTVRPANSDKPK